MKSTVITLFVGMLCAAGYVLHEAGGSSSSRDQITAVIEYTIDGDTLVATDRSGRDLGRVRVLGIDTPELDPLECHAGEAAQAAAGLVTGQNVTLTIGAEERDIYGRLLAHVDVGDVDFAEVMLADGHARWLEDSGQERHAIYQQAEEKARDAKQGVWSCEK